MSPQVLYMESPHKGKVSLFILDNTISYLSCFP